jgi:hypothetical protein
VAANISFVKDVYATGNDVINSRWEDLTNDFVQDVVMQDPTLATLYTNTRSGRPGSLRSRAPHRSGRA